MMTTEYIKKEPEYFRIIFGNWGHSGPEGTNAYMKAQGISDEEYAAYHSISDARYANYGSFGYKEVAKHAVRLIKSQGEKETILMFNCNGCRFCLPLLKHVGKTGAKQIRKIIMNEGLPYREGKDPETIKKTIEEYKKIAKIAAEKGIDIYIYLGEESSNKNLFNEVKKSLQSTKQYSNVHFETLKTKNTNTEYPRNHCCYQVKLRDKNFDINTTAVFDANHFEKRCFDNSSYNQESRVTVNFKNNEYYQKSNREKIINEIKEYKLNKKVNFYTMFFVIIGLIAFGVFTANAYLGFFGGEIFSGLVGIAIATLAALLCLIPAYIYSLHKSSKTDKKTKVVMRIITSVLIIGDVCLGFFGGKNFPGLVDVAIAVGAILLCLLLLPLICFRNVPETGKTGRWKVIRALLIVFALIALVFSLSSLIVVALDYMGKSTQMSQQMLQFLQNPGSMLSAVITTGVFAFLGAILIGVGIYKDRVSPVTEVVHNVKNIKSGNSYGQIIDKTATNTGVNKKTSNNHSAGYIELKIDDTTMRNFGNYVTSYLPGMTPYQFCNLQHIHTVKTTTEADSRGIFGRFVIASKTLRGGDDVALFTVNENHARISKDGDNGAYVLHTSENFRDNKDSYNQLKELMKILVGNGDTEFREKIIPPENIEDKAQNNDNAIGDDDDGTPSMSTTKI